jgi:hypothetical protein
MTPTASPPGLSVSEARLLERLQAHIDGEAALLVAYEELGKECDAEYVRYLTGLIMDDEVRHHAMLTELLDTIRSSVERVPPERQLPHLRPPADGEALVEAVTRLAEFEREDAHDFRQLQKELHDVRDTTIWSLVVELMQLDTEKHIRILHFIKDHAER